MRAFMSEPDGRARWDWTVYRSFEALPGESNAQWRARYYAHKDATAAQEAARVLTETEPAQSSVHVYNGPAALTRSATRVSVNGLTPAGFTVDGRDALAEALTAFVDAL